MNHSVTMDTEAPNNTGGNLTESLYQLNARYADAMVPFAFVLTVLAVIGILGNIIVILVFSICKEYRNTNFKIFAISLACVDLLACVTLIPAEILKTRVFFSYQNPLPCKVKCFFSLFTQSSASLMLLVICIDRFRKVCQPLKKQIWPGLATKILVLVAFLSFLLALPSPFLCGLSDELKLNAFNTTTTVYVCASDKRFKTSLLRNIYKLGVSVVFVAVSLAFIIMYSLILRTIVRHWGNGCVEHSVRFDSRKSSEPVEKLEVDRLTDDVFSPEDLRAIAEYEPGKYSNKLTPDFRIKCNFSKEKVPLRKSSSYTLHGTGSFGRNSLRKQSVNIHSRSGSDASFRVHSFRRRSSAVSGKIPYKTMIWFILTLIFIVTYIIHAVLSFFTTDQNKLSPGQLVAYLFFFRLYFINNIINPVIYAWLDTRFNKSCRKLVMLIKRKISHCC